MYVIYTYLKNAKRKHCIFTVSAKGPLRKTCIFTRFAEGAKRHSCILTWFAKGEHCEFAVLRAFWHRRKCDTPLFTYVFLAEKQVLCILTWCQGNPFSTNHVKMQESGGPTHYALGKMYTVLALWKGRAFSARNGGKIACFAVKEKPSTLAWHVAVWLGGGWLAGR